MTFGLALVCILLGIILVVRVVQSIQAVFKHNNKKDQYNDMMFALAGACGHMFSTILASFFYLFENVTAEFLRVIRISIWIQLGFSIILMILFLVLMSSILIMDFKERAQIK